MPKAIFYALDVNGKVHVNCTTSASQALLVQQCQLVAVARTSV